MYLSSDISVGRKTRDEASGRKNRSTCTYSFIRVNVGRKRELFVFYFYMMYVYLDIQVIPAAWLSLNFFIFTDQLFSLHSREAQF